jgi:hypothetical protein
VRRADDHRPLILGLADNILFDLQSARDDDRMDVLLNGKFLHITTIANDENGLFPIQVVQPAPERLNLHRGHDEDKVTDVAFGRSRQECAADGLNQLLQSSTDFTLKTNLIAGWEQVLADLKGGDKPDAALVLVYYRQTAKALLADPGEGLVDWLFGTDAHNLRVHDIFDARPDTGDEPGCFKAKFRQGVVNSLVRISTARRSHLVRSGRLLELCIGDRRTDRIHVRVLVANYDSLHAFLVARPPLWQ